MDSDPSYVVRRRDQRSRRDPELPPLIASRRLTLSTVRCRAFFMSPLTKLLRS